MQRDILQHKKVPPKCTVLKEFKSHQNKTYQKFSLYLWACMCYQSEGPCPLQLCLPRLPHPLPHKPAERAPLAESQAQILWPCLPAPGRAKKQWARDWLRLGFTQWRNSRAFKQFFTSALPLMCTEKLGMSSSAWPRHPGSLSCSQTANPKHVSRVQAPDPARGTSTTGLEWFSIIISITVAHCPWAHLVHCSSSTCPLVQVSPHKMTAYTQQWISYTTSASHCPHHKTIPPTGSGGVALRHPAPRVLFSLLDTS